MSVFPDTAPTLFLCLLCLTVFELYDFNLWDLIFQNDAVLNGHTGFE